jgi:hypothetical protein
MTALDRIRLRYLTLKLREPVLGIASLGLSQLPAGEHQV